MHDPPAVQFPVYPGVFAQELEQAVTSQVIGATEQGYPAECPHPAPTYIPLKQEHLDEVGVGVGTTVVVVVVVLAAPVGEGVLPIWILMSLGVVVGFGVAFTLHAIPVEAPQVEPVNFPYTQSQIAGVGLEVFVTVPVFVDPFVEVEESVSSALAPVELEVLLVVVVLVDPFVVVIVERDVVLSCPSEVLIAYFAIFKLIPLLVVTAVPTTIVRSKNPTIIRLRGSMKPRLKKLPSFLGIGKL